MRAFSDVRQVIAISTVGTPLDSALATPGVARLKQNRPVARRVRLVVHASIWPPGVTSNFDFIVRLLGYGDLLGKCVRSEMEASRNGRTSNTCPIVRLEARFNQFVRRLSPLNLRTISFAQRTMLNPAPPPDWEGRVVRIADASSDATRCCELLPDDLPQNVAFCSSRCSPATQRFARFRGKADSPGSD
jgi:hypothetical protein